MLRKKEWILSAANRVIKLFGCVIFMILCWYAMRFTQFMIPGDREIPRDIRDSVWKNLLAAGLLAAGFAALRYAHEKADPKLFRRITWIVLGGVMLWMELSGMWWICSAERVPEGDQAYVYGGASYFLGGDYGFLAKLGYFGMFPYQLGLTALMELLFLVTGPLNYFSFQFLCVQMNVAIVWLGDAVLRKLSKSDPTRILYCMFMAACLPMIFYSSWVYGDTPSILCMLLATLAFLSYRETGKKRHLAGMVLAATVAMLVRVNSAIFLIALCAVAVVVLSQKWDKKLGIAIVCAVILPFLVQNGIYKMYEIRSGYPHSQGIPFTATIVMGLQESEGRCGWYNNYQKETLYACDGDYELAARVYREDLRERLDFFRRDAGYAAAFFKSKVLSQWNQPLYQSVYFGNKLQGEHIVEPGTLAYRLCFEHYQDLLRFADRIQFLVYLGALLYFLLDVKKDGEIASRLLAVTLIGGFLFSILWEAKARYSFPYYVLMIPLAARGYECLAELALAKKGSRGRKTGKRKARGPKAKRRKA